MIRNILKSPLIKWFANPRSTQPRVVSDLGNAVGKLNLDGEWRFQMLGIVPSPLAAHALR